MQLLINLFEMHQFHSAYSQGNKFLFDGLEDVRLFITVHLGPLLVAKPYIWKTAQ